MKYKAGDVVRVKSWGWYDENKDKDGWVCDLGYIDFKPSMAELLGKEVEIASVSGLIYRIKEYEYILIDEMIECLVNEKTMINEEVIKDIAEVIKKHNLGVSVSEKDGKIIVEPLKEDLPIDTPCMCSDNLRQWFLRYYKGNNTTFLEGYKSNETQNGEIEWNYIIPFDKFNPNDIEESLKYNIVKNNK